MTPCVLQDFHHKHSQQLKMKFFLLSDLLVPRKLLQRLFCCFPVFRLAKVESSQKSHHICSTVTEAIRVTNNATSFGAINVQKTKFEAAKMILDPWNQQDMKELLKKNQMSHFPPFYNNVDPC